MKRNRAIGGVTLVELLIVDRRRRWLISRRVPLVYVELHPAVADDRSQTQQLMQAIWAAQDRAKQTGQPAGIRLDADPAFPNPRPAPALTRRRLPWLSRPAGTQTKAATR